MLRVVTEESRADGNRATVVVEGDGPEEAMSTAAKHLALAHAATLGVSRPGLGMSGGAYPVGPDGRQVTRAGPGGETADPVATANLAGRRYRCDWPVQGGI